MSSYRKISRGRAWCSAAIAAVVMACAFQVGIARAATFEPLEVVTKSGAQYNHVTYSCGYASSSAGPVHFGLGANASADLVEIHWPSGTVQILKDVAADHLMQVKEPAK